MTPAQLSHNVPFPFALTELLWYGTDCFLSLKEQILNSIITRKENNSLYYDIRG